jgi:hypothetical protein
MPLSKSPWAATSDHIMPFYVKIVEPAKHQRRFKRSSLASQTIGTGHASERVHPIAKKTSDVNNIQYGIN